MRYSQEWHAYHTPGCRLSAKIEPDVARCPVTKITCMLLMLSAFGGYSVAGYPKPLPTFARSFDEFAKLDISFGKDSLHFTTFSRPSVNKCANR
jgi:hypothetical protein